MVGWKDLESWKQRAEKIYDLVFKRNKYVLFNLKSFIKRGSKHAELVEEQQDGQLEYEYTDQPSTPLLMSRGSEMGTRWHEDIGRAHKTLFMGS